MPGTGQVQPPAPSRTGQQLIPRAPTTTGRGQVCRVSRRYACPRLQRIHAGTRRGRQPFCSGWLLLVQPVLCPHPQSRHRPGTGHCLRAAGSSEQALAIFTGTVLSGSRTLPVASKPRELEAILFPQSSPAVGCNEERASGSSGSSHALGGENWLWGGWLC